MLNEVMEALHRISHLKVVVVRVLHRDEVIQFKGGRLDNYYTMGIKL
jgi:hypothetical protein